MSLTRREILEELERLEFHSFSELKKACREFEKYWAMNCRKSEKTFLIDTDRSFLQTHKKP
ncbi:MAG: hypothetical protein JW920_01070 [Deltaproteobacteria bacterium]|nr:hypothetical protein [Deltaproteobacteria bacterium]